MSLFNMQEKPLYERTTQHTKIRKHVLCIFKMFSHEHSRWILNMNTGVHISLCFILSKEKKIQSTITNTNEMNEHNNWFVYKKSQFSRHFNRQNLFTLNTQWVSQAFLFGYFLWKIPWGKKPSHFWIKINFFYVYKMPCFMSVCSIGFAVFFSLFGVSKNTIA